jgi:hypothetical protein
LGAQFLWLYGLILATKHIYNIVISNWKFIIDISFCSGSASGWLSTWFSDIHFDSRRIVHFFASLRSLLLIDGLSSGSSGNGPGGLSWIYKFTKNLRIHYLFQNCLFFYHFKNRSYSHSNNHFKSHSKNHFKNHFFCWLLNLAKFY